MNDKEYMARALDLARRGAGWTRPNPMVGAVIVKEGKIIGEGYHRRYGDLHAERDALSCCHGSPRGAQMYVTLEPCCHHGHQPPCTEAIIKAGISRVVIGSNDPNPLVGGKGIEKLKEHGIQVETGVLKEECDALNRVFFHFVQTGRPYVTLKYAMTLDGKIATHKGASRWITGEEARRRVHEDRHKNAAILTGVGTVLADDPLLTCRLEGKRNPLRVICDSHLKTPLDSQIVRTAKEVPTVLAVIDESKKEPYEAAGCQVWRLKEREGHVDLEDLMKRLDQEKIDSVLLEGGGTLNWEALNQGVVQAVQAYVAPKLFGGAWAKSPVEGAGVELPAQCARLSRLSVTAVGEDILVEGEIKDNVYGNR